MKILYIDVYFLINFTTDVLAIYFGAIFAKIESNARRLILSGAIGAFLACAVALFSVKGIFFFSILILGALLITLVFCGKATHLRRLKFLVSFIVFETLIGGFITAAYNFMDSYLTDGFYENSVEPENKNLIVLSLLILLTYGILKLLFLLLFSSRHEKNARLKIFIGENEFELEGLIDSGNLVCDPMTKKPVIIVKRRAVEKIVGSVSLTENSSIKTRIRIIPIKSVGGEKMLIGIRSDYVILEGTEDKINGLVIAIDEDDGSFGGYLALIPLSIAERI